MADREAPGPPSTDGHRAGEAPDAAAPRGSRALEPAPPPTDPFSLDRLVEGAVAELRGLAGGKEGGGVHAAEQAMAHLVEGIVRTNLHLADAVFRPGGAADLADLQRRFVQDYLAALARGGTMLRQVADGAAADGTSLGTPVGTPIGGTPLGSAILGGAKVGDAMRRDIACASPDDTVRDAMRRMAEQRLSALPVCEHGRLVGVAMDRDLAGRIGGADEGAAALRAAMRADPPFVFDDDPLPLAILGMADQHAMCLPVVDRERRVVGVLALDGAAPRRIGLDAAG